MDQLLANDILLLMLDLSPIRDEDEMLRVFIDFLNQRLPGLALEFHRREPPGGQGEILAVATGRNRFGWVSVRGDSGRTSRETMDLVRHAVGLLALVLENLYQSILLRDENARPDHPEDHRARKLVQADQRLRREVQERRKAEEALRLSEERLRLAMEATADGLWEWDVASGRVLWSPRCYTMLGYQPDEFPVNLDTWLELVHPEDREPARRSIQEKMARPGGPFAIEFRHRAKDGSWRRIICRGRGVEWDSEDNPVRVIGTYVDVIERKWAEQTIRDMSQRFQRLVDHLPEGILVHTKDLIDYANQAAARLFGARSAHDLVGTNVFERFAPERHDLIRERMSRMLASNRAAPAQEAEYLRLDGSRIQVEVSAVPTVWRGRKAHLVIIRDITDRKIMEVEKEELARQLRQAQKMEAIGTLAGGVAHDFNNILAAIMGYSEFALEETQEGRDCSDELNQVIEAAGRARDLVRQILTFSRKVDFAPFPLDLNQAMGQAREVLGRTLPKMIEIVYQPAPDLHPVHADANQMEQVLLNLGGNAADAMPQGGRLTIRTENVTLDDAFCRSHLEVHPGQYVLLTVSDTGQGMDGQTLRQIFDPFFSTKQPGKGTGLGLSTVYGIVTGHGGHIFCSSRPGQGAAFSIYLPARPETPLPDPEDRAKTSSRHGDEHILLVDDEEALRQVGGALLTRAGYAVRTAASGEEALEVFRRSPGEVDLVVLDLGMPGMGGLKCLGGLLRLAPETRVLIASGYAANGEIQQSLDQGAAGYIAKPFRKNELLGAVRRVLDRAG